MTNPVIDKFYKSNITTGKKGASIAVDLHIEVPFTKLMEGLVANLRAGAITPDQYYGILDMYEHDLEVYRNIKV